MGGDPVIPCGESSVDVPAPLPPPDLQLTRAKTCSATGRRFVWMIAGSVLLFSESADDPSS